MRTEKVRKPVRFPWHNLPCVSLIGLWASCCPQAVDLAELGRYQPFEIRLSSFPAPLAVVARCSEQRPLGARMLQGAHARRRNIGFFDTYGDTFFLHSIVSARCIHREGASHPFFPKVSAGLLTWIPGLFITWVSPECKSSSFSRLCVPTILVQCEYPNRILTNAWQNCGGMYGTRHAW